MNILSLKYWIYSSAISWLKIFVFLRFTHVDVYNYIIHVHAVVITSVFLSMGIFIVSTFMLVIAHNNLIDSTCIRVSLWYILDNARWLCNIHLLIYSPPRSILTFFVLPLLWYFYCLIFFLLMDFCISLIIFFIFFGSSLYFLTLLRTFNLSLCLSNLLPSFLNMSYSLLGTLFWIVFLSCLVHLT